MTTILSLFPFLVSSFIGYFLIHFLDDDKKIPTSSRVLLGCGLGLGLSAYITFFSFLIFDQLNRLFIITIHLLLFLFLLRDHIVSQTKKTQSGSFFKSFGAKDLVAVLTILVCLLPTIYMLFLYPEGGWDAWSVWNVKAKILFLGQEHWKNIFLPVLWRTSPHYPLLLPLMNVWGWIFNSQTGLMAPILLCLIFTILNISLLFYALKDRIRLWINLLISALLLTLPFFYKFAASQYADIVVGFYLFASLYCLVQARMQSQKVFALLSGLFLGFLSFSKNEGLTAGLMILLLAIPYLQRKNSFDTKKILMPFLAGAFISFIPLMIFQTFYAPANLTFINGFTSSIKPTGFSRLQVVLIFYLMLFKNLQWNGLWVMFVAGMILGRNKILNRDMIIIPVFLMLYGGVVTFYYLLNTYFEIGWWMSETLHRILFSLLPTISYWIFLSLFSSRTAIDNSKP
ncbi:MAG: hypothetical protein HQL24_08175 [Candidatus Omnitrophica bacterium]|nr:hypothetical protein [Candidatus Omnitrophota bacterium]